MSSGPVSDSESDGEDFFTNRIQAIISNDKDKIAADQKEESENRPTQFGSTDAE